MFALLSIVSLCYKNTNGANGRDAMLTSLETKTKSNIYGEYENATILQGLKPKEKCSKDLKVKSSVILEMKNKEFKY